MKKEIAFIASMMILGIALGLGVVGILGAIAMPNYTGHILTHAEKADFELVPHRFAWIAKYPYVIPGIVIFFIVTVGILLLINLNPNFRINFKEKTARLKSAAVLLCVPVCMLLLFVSLGFHSSLYFMVHPSLLNTTTFLFFFASMGFLWLVVGETGWAGDFSSWKMGVRGKGAKPFLSFLLGGVTGSAAFGLYYLFAWSFDKYFLLVSEVLDKSAETSYLGFKLLCYELMFMSSMSLGILSGLMTSLSPTYKTPTQRLKRLIFPAVLLAILIPVIMNTYHEAVTKYDLGKKSLAEAVGVPEKASLSKTIVLLLPNKAVLQEWPLQTKGSSLMGTSTIELSYENLKKVEDYIAGHKEGSLYNYVAYDVLMRGYFGLGDVRRGVEQQFKNAELILLHRLLLVSQLRYLPVTQDNLNYLKSFGDEGKWYVGGRYALRIAEAFMHFGLADEAKAWVEKAKAQGEDISKITFLNDGVLVDGKITGAIRIHGNPPVHAKALLVRYTEGTTKIDDTSLPNRLVDVRELDHLGRFAFERLGKGEYFLAIMTGKEMIPYDLPKERLNVNSNLAVIRLDAHNPVRDLGVIHIAVK